MSLCEVMFLNVAGQITIVNPTDNGFEVYSSTQWASETQRAIAQVLGVPDNQ